MDIENHETGGRRVRRKLRWVPWALAMFAVIGAFSWAEAQEAPAVPVLPDVPFEYVDDGLPQHFIDAPHNIPDNNPITNEGATLGRVLFYDRRLSANDTTSCASCHDQALAFADSGRFSEGFDGQSTTRNSMGLTNARFYERERFLWGEEAATLEDQVLLPVDSEIELGLGRSNLPPKLEATSFYPELFEDAFGTADITNDRISRALAQFIRTLASAGSKFDEVLAGRATFTESEELGRIAFSVNCSFCHVGSLQVALQPPTNNATDLTLADEGAGQGRFKVPSLRNVELTGPYMHDGSQETLEEVVEHYNSRIPEGNDLVSPPLGGPMNLTDAQKTGLVDFMLTLTDPGFTTDVRFSDPFDQAVDLPPQVIVPPIPSLVVGEPFAIQLIATDPEGSPITWSAPLPSWLTLSSTGRLTGVAPQPGTFGFAVTASDGVNAVTVPVPLTILSTSEVEADLDCGEDIAHLSLVLSNDRAGFVEYVVRVGEVEATSIAEPFNVVGLTFDLEDGTYPTTVAIRAPGGDRVIFSELIAVQCTENSPPVIAGVDRQGASLNAPYSLEIEVFDADDDPIALSATGLPAGLVLAPGSNLISGTPTELGSFTVLVRAQDPFSTTTLSFPLNVIEAEVQISVNCGIGNAPTTIAVQLTNPLDIGVVYEVGIGPSGSTVPVLPNGLGSASAEVSHGPVLVNVVRFLSPTVGVLVFEDVGELNCAGDDQYMHVVSCLAGNGRFDLNIVNGGSSSATYRVQFEGLSPRARNVLAGDWWRLPITGRPDNDYQVRIERDGVVVSERTVTIACDLEQPLVDSDEVRVVNACRAGDGYLIFQFVNSTDQFRSWVIEFTSVANRSTSARAFGAAPRAVTGRPNGTYPVTIRSGGSVVETFDVVVNCP